MENMTEFDVPEEVKVGENYEGAITTKTIAVTVDHEDDYIEGEILIEYSASSDLIATIAYTDDLVDYFNLEPGLFMQDGAANWHDDLIDLDGYDDPGNGEMDGKILNAIGSFLKSAFYGDRVDYPLTGGPCEICENWWFDHWFVGEHSCDQDCISCFGCPGC